MAKRMILFFLVNMAVVATAMIILNLLGVRGYLTPHGMDYSALMIFCFVYGMAGSFISLLLSKQMAKWMMGLKIIDLQSFNPMERDLVEKIKRLSQLASLTKMPEVGIYESPEVNAFATGPSRNNSLVAVSTGLLNAMNDAEVEGVLAHEISHIANGDMVTMTLVQGVINAFVMFFSKMVAWILAQALSGEEEEKSPPFYLVFMLEMVLFTIFGLLGGLVVAWFSRQREFSADRDAAKIAGSHKMISALERLKGSMQIEHSNTYMATMKIESKKSWFSLLSTHPSLEDRIRRLQGL